MIKIAPVIPTFNRKNHLESVLINLYSQKISTHDLLIEPVIVVDGSKDGTLQMLEKYPVKIIYGDGSWWFTKSMNEGSKYAFELLNADFVLTLNDDIIIEKDYLQSLYNDYISLGIKNLILGSVSLIKRDKDLISFSGISHVNLITGTDIPYVKYGTPYLSTIHNGTKPTISLPTRGTLIPKACFYAVNGFDNALPQYGSDNDFVLRARKKGFIAYVSYNATVYEIAETTGKGSPRINKNFISFCKEFLFNQYSPTYLRKNVILIWRHKRRILFPWYFTLMIIGTIKSFFKYK